MQLSIVPLIVHDTWALSSWNSSSPASMPAGCIRVKSTFVAEIASCGVSSFSGLVCAVTVPSQ